MSDLSSSVEISDLVNQNTVAGDSVVFLLTDVEGSSRLHEQYPAAMRAAMTHHDACIRQAVESQGGRVLKLRGGGDSVFAVFSDPGEAVRAAYSMEQALEREVWPDNLALRVRVGLHIGETEERDGDYVGNDVNRCARLRDIGHGGQILLTRRMAEAAQEAGLPDGVSLRDMGLHRFKDLRKAEYVYQLVAPDVLDGFLPLRSLSLSPNNLPERLDSFIGRETEVETIRRALSSSGSPLTMAKDKKIRTARLLTITGTGGGGKTRLAIQAGAELLEEFPDGVWFVDLSGLAEGRLVPQSVAATLAVREAANMTVADAVTAHCKTKTILLILDNCEHLLEDSARLVKTLLQSCPNLRVLVTSREALGVEGEQTYALPTLSTPNPKYPLDWETVTASPAVRLFEERARARKEGFAVGPENAALVARICHRLDGVPLYVELVAPKVRMLSLKEIDGRLYKIISANAPGLSGKHRNQRALIGWSVDLLSPEERRLLLRLSIFAGGWTLEAAEHVCAGAGLDEWQVFDALDRLVSASLVVAETQEETSRFRLLETIREYSHEELVAAGEEIETQDQHIAYFLEFAEECEPKLQGPEQSGTLQQLETEHDNFRAALKWANGETRLRLAGTLARFWTMRGFLTEGISWLQGALTTGRNVAPAFRAKALNGFGDLAMRQGDYATARQSLEESRILFASLQDNKGLGTALNNLGLVACEQGRYDEAVVCYEESLSLRRMVGNKWEIAATLNNLGYLKHAQSNSSMALAHFEESLAIYRQLHDSIQVANTSNNLGVIVLDANLFEKAKIYFNESLAAFQQLGNPLGIAAAMYNLGEVARQTKDFQEAQRYYKQSLSIRYSMGVTSALLRPLIGLGHAASEQGHLQWACEMFATASKVQDETGVHLSVSDQTHFEQAIQTLRSNMGEMLFSDTWNQNKNNSHQILCKLI